MGVGASIVAFAVFTMLYFDKYRATANAIKFVGWSASGVAGPLVLSSLASSYGLGGTLLLSASIALHAVPLVMLVQSPRPLILNCLQCTSVTCETRSGQNVTLDEEKSDLQRSVTKSSLSANNRHRSSSHDTEFRKGLDTVYQLSTVYSISAVGDTTAVSTSLPSCLCARGSCICVASRATHKDSKVFCVHNTFLTMQDQCQQKTPTKQSTLMENLSGQLTLFRDPVFYILLTAFALCDCTVSMHTTTTVDYGLDKGIALEDATLVITYSYLGQILGRTLLPWASDTVANGRCKFAVACYCGAAVSYGILSAARSLPVFVALNVTLGLFEGFVTCIRSVLVSEYLGIDRLPAFFGFQGIALLPLCLSEPAIIGKEP
ncbi:hypothetical protein HPB48_018929 [Haemaphysalis longicornis]|uniref:Monocarboxylate transporter n=1 Tax=Haemaphysalis longicornis TaxID=44386 RepID=A0A9J6GSL0_HAELO|nr:hypothetical protein HPB48_018929 [Haemaphysalis longicornis]